MAFHVQPTSEWKPEKIRDSLLAIGLAARIECGFLRVDAPVSHRSSPVRSFLQTFRVLRPIFGTGYPPYHEFRICHDRFVNNLEIHWNVDSLAENGQIMNKIRDVMVSNGYPEVGLRPTEREVIQQYGVMSNEMDATLTELETLRGDRAARRDPTQFWERWRLLNARMESLCLTAFSV